MSEAQTIAAGLKPSILKSILKRIIPLKKTVMLWGGPGTAKSAIVRQGTDELNYTFYDIRTVLLDPVDLRGLPFKDGNVTRWAPPCFLPQPSERPSVLFLDELPQAPTAVQASLLQLTLDRRLGEYVLPDNCTIIAAGNRQSDRAGGHRMITPLLNRFLHLEIAVDPEDWQEWARSAGIHAMVRGYLKWKPSSLYQFDPRADARAFPTLRSWEYVSDIIPACDDSTILSITEGCVGTAHASEFTAFVKTYRDLPDVDGLLADPKNAAVPDRVDVIWALCMALSEKARSHPKDKKTLGAIATYAAKLGEAPNGQEFCVMLYKDCLLNTDGNFNVIPESKPLMIKYGHLITAGL